MQYFDTMISVLRVNGEKLTNDILQGYVGGQAEMHHSTGEKTVGDIDNIELAAGAIDIDCTWIACKGEHKRKWRNTELEPTMTVILERGYERYACGSVIVLGENGNLILRVKGDADNIDRP